jgi:hypothetical protein
MTKYLPYLYSAFLVTVLFQTSCSKDQFEITPPSYIEINEFIADTGCYPTLSNRRVLNSSNVTDAWVYIDGKLQGTYELPARFPVINEGSHQIEIRPGIKRNGISATRVIYPFYEYDIRRYTLEKDKVLSITPCLAYRVEGPASGEIKVAWEEDFEGVVDLSYNPMSDTVVEPTSNPDHVHSGNFAGSVTLDPNHDFFELLSPELTGLPINGTPIYLELNYKSNHDFSVGIYADNREIQQILYSFRARDEWTKVYVDFSDAVRFNGNAPNFNVFIGFLKDDAIPNVQMYFDNIALLYL